jgi:hypothetical protein
MGIIGRKKIIFYGGLFLSLSMILFASTVYV